MATGIEISAVFCAAAEQNALAGRLPVEPRCRRRGVRQPVQRDVVENVVAVQQARGLAVVVVVDPGRKPHRRVGQGVADRLRPRAHDDAVGAVLLVEGVKRVERCAFLLGESRRRGPATGEHRRHVGGDRRRQIDVDAEQSCRCLARHRAGDRGAPVAALGDIAGVAQALHQLRPGAGDAIRIPAPVLRLSGEAVAGHRRDHEMKRVGCARAMRRGIGERIDDLQLLDDRAGPSVRHDERQRIFMPRTNVNEMDVDAVDLGHEHGSAFSRASTFRQS